MVDYKSTGLCLNPDLDDWRFAYPSAHSPFQNGYLGKVICFNLDIILALWHGVLGSYPTQAVGAMKK